MRRAVLVALLVPLVAFSSTGALTLPTLPPGDGMPVGLNAVENIVTFAMAHPARFGEGPAMELAREDLLAKLAAMGYETERHDFGEGVNILGVKPGVTRPNDWVVISAHYDVAVTPFNGVGAAVHGAWDDGAGVAAVLEIARVAAEREWNHTVAIAFFDDEERGLIGAANFVPAYNGKAWEHGTIRLVADLNMDPPGLNWPCVTEAGLVLPVTFMQWRPNGAGATLLRNFAFEAREAEGVPDDAWEYFTGAFQIGYVLSGVSDNVAFGNRGVPDLYVGSSMHLRAGGAAEVQTLYPLHTPADTIGTLAAFCGGPIQLARALEVEMRIMYRTLISVDSYGPAFPRP